MGRVITKHIGEDLDNELSAAAAVVNVAHPSSPSLSQSTHALIHDAEIMQQQAKKKRKRNTQKTVDREKYYVGFTGPALPLWELDNVPECVKELSELLKVDVDALKFDAQKYMEVTKEFHNEKLKEKDRKWPCLNSYYIELKSNNNSMEERYRMDFDTPGIDVKDVRFTVNARDLLWEISGSRQVDVVGPNNECFIGAFSRVGTLPIQIDLSRKWASDYKNGVYSVLFYLKPQVEITWENQ